MQETKTFPYMIRIVILCFAILTLFTSVLCEVVQIKSCPNDESINCQIDEVRITPCKEASKNQRCKFKKKSDAHLEIDFTPSFLSENITSQMFSTGFLLDLPLIGMDTDGCKTTPCPTTKDQKQTYTFDLHIEYPSGKYDVKHLLTGVNKETEKCCYIYQIHILR